MKKTFLILILFSSMAFGLQNCKRKSSCGYTETKQVYKKVEDRYKTKIPYTGTDTLIFISNTGDTATLYGKGKKQYYVEVSSLPSNPDCGIPEVNANYENIDYTFTGPNPLLPRLVYSAYLNDKEAYPLFNNMRISTAFLTKTSSFEYLENTVQSKDSVNMNGNIQYGVYLDISENWAVLFNYEYGILKLTETNNRVWTKFK